MNQPSIDRCPRCGSPYMSSMLANETPETRYCYTCATAASGAKKQIETSPASDDFELQPLDTSGITGGKPPGRLAKAFAAKAVRRSNPTEPSASADSPALPRERVLSRSRPGSDNASAPKGFPIKSVVGMCAIVLTGIIAFYALKKNPTPPQSTAQALNVPPKIDVSVAPPKVAMQKDLNKKTAQEVASKSSPLETVASPAESVAAQDVSKNIGITAQDARATLPAPPLPAPALAAAPEQEEAKPAATDLSHIIGKSARKNSEENTDEGDVVVAPAPATKPKTDIVAPAAPATEVAANPDLVAAPETPADANRDLDKDGNPKKHRSILENLGEPEMPVKHETEKKENPFAPKIVPVTVAEPTVMPLDIERIGGNDKTMSTQLADFLPNWRIRDANFTVSKVGVVHQGREKTIVLNPMNDVLPAKLIATVEIPKSFAGARPMLLFEISSATTGKDWALTVKAMGVDMLQKTKIKLPKDAPWQDVAVDLSPLADKHFDLQIEVNATSKHPKGTASEVGFIRNVRIEWMGKAKK